MRAEGTGPIACGRTRMTDHAAAAGVPALGGWRTVTIALGCALLIGGIGGLIGLGGGEFRLPILVGLIGFAARAAVPMNQILSLVTLTTALVVRWHTGSLVGVGAFAPAVIALGIGGVTAAWFAARLLSHVSDHRLERAIAILLMAIGLLLIGERPCLRACPRSSLPNPAGKWSPVSPSACASA